MFTLTEILTATQGTLIQGPSKSVVKGVSIDSRKVQKSECFIAVKGEIFDGHDFISDVTTKGVRMVIVHRPVIVEDPKVSVILVRDTTRALGDLARFHRLRFKIPIITITGSAGKTTTKEMIAAVLSRKFRVLKNEGTQNNHIGVPLTLLKLYDKHDIVVLECGTNQPGDIVWLADVARATAAVFTNIGESHLEKLKTVEGVLKEKWHLVDFLKTQAPVIINGDDPLLKKQSVSFKRKFDIISFGIKNKSLYQAKSIEVIDGRYLQFKVASQTCRINTCGLTHVYNALAAYSCGVLYKVPLKQIAAALEGFEFPSGRGQIMRLGKGWLINDSYNANPVSMRSALQTLEAIDVTGRRIFIAADMLELGSQAAQLHKSIGKDIASSSVDVLITVGNLSQHMAKAAQAQNKKFAVYACSDVETAQKYLIEVFRNGDAVLIKGSRRMAMERMADFLLTAPKGEAV